MRCISDIAAIAGICHARGVPLIVDEAHGAHWVFTPSFPEEPQAGQTRLFRAPTKRCQVNEPLFCIFQKILLDPEKIEYQRHIRDFKPLYPLMASLDGCTGVVKNRRELS